MRFSVWSRYLSWFSYADHGNGSLVFFLHWQDLLYTCSTLHLGNAVLLSLLVDGQEHSTSTQLLNYMINDFKK